MGDRLVSKISYKGEFFAASYQHWSAGDWEQLESILDDLIAEYGFFDDEHIRTKEEAAHILFEMLEKYNDSVYGEDYEPKYGLLSSKTAFEEYQSKKQEDFNKKSSLPIGSDRTDGLITIDETIASYWESRAEAVNDFNWEG